MTIRTCMRIVSGLLLVSVTGARAQEIDQKIDIEARGYIPPTIEISVGQKIMWANMTQKEQSVVSANKLPIENPETNQIEKPLFDSGPILINRYFVYTFDKPGTFEYYNRKDPSMRGTVIVKEPE